MTAYLRLVFWLWLWLLAALSTRKSTCDDYDDCSKRRRCVCGAGTAIKVLVGAKA